MRRGGREGVGEVGLVHPDRDLLGQGVDRLDEVWIKLRLSSALVVRHHVLQAKSHWIVHASVFVSLVC